ncbi:hypothetical protein HDV04_004416 [Boothiomyces sp. JEL0838]|nr:hypothetical protein HDV04_004416 [Boothiomyces sp. JEL0838]
MIPQRSNASLIFDRVKQGFIIGFSAGAAAGLFIGGIQVLTSGPLPGKTYVGTIGRAMLQSGGWFGLLVAVGSTIRGDCEGPAMQSYLHKQVYISRIQK